MKNEWKRKTEYYEMKCPYYVLLIVFQELVIPIKY